MGFLSKIGRAFKKAGKGITKGAKGAFKVTRGLGKTILKPYAGFIKTLDKTFTVVDKFIKKTPVLGELDAVASLVGVNPLGKIRDAQSLFEMMERRADQLVHAKWKEFADPTDLLLDTITVAGEVTGSDKVKSAKLRKMIRAVDKLGTAQKKYNALKRLGAIKLIQPEQLQHALKKRTVPAMKRLTAEHNAERSKQIIRGFTGGVDLSELARAVGKSYRR